jgi:prevent-host-death family protein
MIGGPDPDLGSALTNAGLLDLASVTIQLNVQEAKTRLSQILAQAEAGEDVIIARGGKPVARLVPVAGPAPRPVGFVEGTVGDSFFEPLPDDELARWQ